MEALDGLKNPERRATLEAGGPDVSDEWGEYRKTTTTFARQMAGEFRVHTLEGEHLGKAGDWLACGVAGEMYPIDAAVFEATYAKVTDNG